MHDHDLQAVVLEEQRQFNLAIAAMIGTVDNVVAGLQSSAKQRTVDAGLSQRLLVTQQWMKERIDQIGVQNFVGGLHEILEENAYFAHLLLGEFA